MSSYDNRCTATLGLSERGQPLYRKRKGCYLSEVESAARFEVEDTMAKLRKGKKVKRSVAKRKKKSVKSKKRSPGVGERISGMMNIVSGAMSDTTRMRRKMKRRTPFDEG